MLNTIISILRESPIQVWRLTETAAKTAELYFIRQALDMPRLKETVTYTVEVFRDFEENGVKFRGSTTCLISSGMTEQEIRENLEDAYFAAFFVKNKWFRLPEAIRQDTVQEATDLSSMTVEAAAAAIAQGLFAADGDSTAFINSAEIFANQTKVHIIASNGLDVSYVKWGVSGELVAQCREPKDVEQHRTFRYDSLNIPGLQKLAQEAIRDVQMRAKTSRMPKTGTYPVLLKGDHLRELFSYYVSRSSAGMIFPGYSRWQVGSSVQGEAICGEKLNVTLEPSDPYSPEGIPMIRRTLLRDGTLETIHGGARFCDYLGVEPTGDYRKISCENGTTPVADMQGDGVLEPVSFSDFQMDEMDGHFKGEIRLALLHHSDGSVEALTGGSINGSLLDAQGNLIFSLERYSDSRYSGPLAVQIPDVRVAGE